MNDIFIKMLLRIEAFRSHIARELTINGGISLIRGISGAGKSTLFKSIEWCFFGSMTNVYPMALEEKDKRKITCSVTVEMKGMIVYRRKKPELLIVQIKEGEFRDEAAQHIINNKLGDRVQWLSSSYIQQGEGCHFLSLSNVNKMDMLNKIGLGQSELIEQYLTRIDIRIAKITQGIEINKGMYRQILEGNKGCNNSIIIDISKFIKIEDRNNIIAKANELWNKIALLNMEQRRYLDDNNKRQILDRSIRELQITTNNENSSVQDLQYELAECRIKLTKLHDDINRYHQRQRIIRDCDELKLPKDYTPDNKLTSLFISIDNVNKLAEHHSNYNYYKNMCGDLCPYNMQPIREQINLLSSFSQQVNNRQHLQQLKQQLNAINIAECEPSDNISKKLQVLLLGRDILTCPSCKQSLRYTSSYLTVATEQPSNKGEIDKVQNDLYFARQQEYSKAGKQILEKQIKDLQQYITTDEIPPDYMQRLHRLQNVQVIAAPLIGVSEARYAYIYNNLENLRKELAKLAEVDFASTNILIERTNSTIMQLQQRLENRKMWDRTHQRIIELQTQLNSIKIGNDKSQDIAKYSAEYTHMHESINYSNNMDRGLHLQAQLKLHEDMVTRATKDYTTLLSLKQDIINAECIALEHIINTINNIISDVTNYIFDEPITISLNLVKELKSHRMKSQVNIAINYRNITYTDVNQMSGGEFTRVSLALTIAFHKLCGSNMLFLDECLSTLDNNVKDSCLRCLRHLLPNDIIIIVNHDTVEGVYDRVIPIS